MKDLVSNIAMACHNLATEEDSMKNYEQAYINFEKSINFLEENSPGDELLHNLQKSFNKFKKVIIINIIIRNLI